MYAIKSSGQLGILRQNSDLAQFVVEGEFTGRLLGNGYFGSVEEVRNSKPCTNCLVCAAHFISLCIDLDCCQRSFMCCKKDQAICRA